MVYGCYRWDWMDVNILSHAQLNSQFDSNSPEIIHSAETNAHFEHLEIKDIYQQVARIQKIL